MSMQQIMRWGHDFPKDKEGEIFNLWGPTGKIQLSKGEPIKPSTTHFVFCAQSFNPSKIWLS